MMPGTTGIGGTGTCVAGCATTEYCNAVTAERQRHMTEEMPEIRLVGEPTGPKKFVPEIGLEVGTFTEEPGGSTKALSWHVPLNFRGHFRPQQLANYDSEYHYRVDKLGFALCCKKTAAGNPCKRKAVNRYPRCELHGGRLHPLDKMLTETGEDETEQPMSRYQLFLAKQITIDDLDDEELMALGFRDARGRIFRPKAVPREMAEEFKRAIFDRALDKLKVNALEAANTLSSIMLDPTVDATVRVRAATEILDRTVGKAPLLVSLNASPAWETVFAAIATKPQQEIIDTEEVPDALQVPVLPPDVKPPGME